MTVAKKQKQKALEAFLKMIEPDQAAQTIKTILSGYLPTDNYCQSNERDRHNLLFVGQSIIDLFNQMGGSYE